MNRHYANAEELLPPDLLDQVQQYVGVRGRLLWIPGRGATHRQKRDAHILTLRDRGYPAAHIAMIHFTSVRTVRRVFERHRKGKLHPNALELYRALSAPSDPVAQQDQSNPGDDTRR